MPVPRAAVLVFLGVTVGCASRAPSPSSAAAAHGAPGAGSAPAPYMVDTVSRGLRNPWTLAFLPDGGMLVSEKYGQLLR